MKSVGQTNLLFQYWATDGGISADKGMDVRGTEGERERDGEGAKWLEKAEFAWNIQV